MPIFEYQCNACKAKFEKLVFANDEEEITCPDCSSTDVNKKMSAANLAGSSLGGPAGCAGGGARPVP